VGLIERIEATQFLGREFATWLYWRSETGNGKIALDGIEESEVWFEAPVELVNDFGDATSVILKGSTPLESPEARQAMRENKKVQRARMRVNFKGQTYTFGFNAAQYLVSGLKLPVPPNAPAADYIYLRLEILEEFEAYFHSLFEAFLKLRLDDKKWQTESRKLSGWVKAFELG
jgi:recombination associated protein RdgC